MTMIKCFSLRCGEEFKVDESSRNFNRQAVICPACNASNTYTSGRLRYKNRAERNERIKEFKNEVRQ